MEGSRTIKTRSRLTVAPWTAARRCQSCAEAWSGWHWLPGLWSLNAGGEPGLLDTKVEFDGDVFRNIVSLRTFVALSDDLTDVPTEQDAANQAEMRVRPSMPSCKKPAR